MLNYRACRRKGRSGGRTNEAHPTLPGASAGADVHHGLRNRNTGHSTPGRGHRNHNVTLNPEIAKPNPKTLQQRTPEVPQIRNLANQYVEAVNKNDEPAMAQLN